jgi:predicted phosphodiesterase
MLRSDRLSRRELLGLSAGTLLTAGLWPGALRAEEKSSSGTFHFVVANDVHYLNERCGKWFEGVIQRMKGHSEKIEFCLLAGDLTEHGKPEQMAPMRDLLASLGKPVYVVVGNHDYRAQDDRKAYDQLFPQRSNYLCEHNGWQFLALDTTEGQRVHGTHVQPHTLSWLDETLPKLDKKRPTIVFIQPASGVLRPLPRLYRTARGQGHPHHQPLLLFQSSESRWHSGKGLFLVPCEGRNDSAYFCRSQNRLSGSMRHHFFGHRTHS